MAIICYTRVSTDEQAESGAGLAAQLFACRGWAARSGAGLAAVFTDEGLSGAKSLEDRPALLDAVARLGSGDVLLVAKRDRLGRDPIVVALIEASVSRKGARVVSAAGEGTEGDEPSNVLMRRMVDAFAEYERLIIKARTRAALAAKARRGERVGGVPFGSRLAADGRTLLPDAAELGTLALIRRLRADGLSLRAVAAALNRRGVPTKNGGPEWIHTSVVKALRREEHSREASGEDGRAGVA